MNWFDANQQYLMAAVGVVREKLECFKDFPNQHGVNKNKAGAESKSAQQKLDHAAQNLSSPSALDTLTDILGLTPFERRILLMCAGMELDSTFATLCATLQGEPRRPYPTIDRLHQAHWKSLQWKVL